MPIILLEQWTDILTISQWIGVENAFKPLDASTQQH